MLIHKGYQGSHFDYLGHSSVNDNQERRSPLVTEGNEEKNKGMREPEFHKLF